MSAYKLADLRDRRARRAALVVLLVLLVACSSSPSVVERVTVAPTGTQVPAPTATAPVRPSATASASPTPAPTSTPAPLPTLPATPQVAANAELLFQSQALDVYAAPDVDPALRAWLLEQPQRFDQIVRDVEDRVGAGLVQRVVLVVQPPKAGEAFRENCPARGAASRTEDGHLAIFLFADATTSDAQKEAVVAHEIAHQVIYSKLGPGGDTILNEGLATWAIPDLWSLWQQAASFDSFVIESIARGTYVPLTESVARNFARPRPGEDCLETRDQLYNEWASFDDFLIRRYGWNAIRRFWQQPVERGQEYDYRVGFGKTLAELEQEWLAQLGRGET